MNSTSGDCSGELSVPLDDSWEPEDGDAVKTTSSDREPPRVSAFNCLTRAQAEADGLPWELNGLNEVVAYPGEAEFTPEPLVVDGREGLRWTYVFDGREFNYWSAIDGDLWFGFGVSLPAPGGSPEGASAAEVQSIIDGATLDVQ